MTREQAKEILSMYRAGGADAGDPFFAEALEAANSDPTLKAWLCEQEAFEPLSSAPVLYKLLHVFPGGSSVFRIRQSKISRSALWRMPLPSG